MAIIGSAYVEIRALDSKLQRDVDKAVSKIKDVNVTLQANVNLKPVRDKISLLRAELKRSPLKFRAEVDLDRVMDDIGAAYDLYEETPLELQANVNTNNAVAALEGIKGRYSDIHATVQANAATQAAEKQINHAARNRRSNINLGVKIDPAYEKALKGLGYTIAGAVPGDKVKAAILGTAGNFETLAIAGAKTAVVMGSIAAVIGTLSADILTIGADITQGLKIVNLAPAVFGLMAAGIAATTLAWKGFGEAFSTDSKKAAEALAKLPPEAQEAVKSLRGVGGEIRKTTQASYWKEMGTSIQTMHDKFLPALKEGLEGTGTSMAKMTKGLVGGLHEAAARGHVENMFNGINKALTNMSKGVKPVVESLFQIGSVGADYLERFGTKLGDAGIKFGEFIDKADKAGKIDVWIKQSIETFKDLGSILSSSGQIMKGLTLISQASGGKGLDDMATGLENIAKIVNGEPFKSNLITVLSGARTGAEKLGAGFGKLAGLIADSSASIAVFLDLAGEIGGELFERISDVFDGTGIGHGFTIALQGARTAVQDMEPAFRDLGIMLGDLGEIAGTLFESMAPGINNLMATLRGVIAEVKDGVIAVIPVFNEFIQGILQVAAPLAIAFADALGNVLVAFANLPSVIQTAIMSLGLFLLLKKSFGNFFGGLGTSINKEGETVNRRFDGIRRGARETTSNVRNSFQGLGFGISEAGRLAAQGFGKNIDLVTNGLPGKLAKAGADVKAGFANGLNLSSEFNGTGQRFSALGSRMVATARTTGDSVRNTFAKLGNALAPADTAVGNFVRTSKAMADQMHYNMQPARDAFTALERQARTSGTNAARSLGDGLKKGAVGLSDALGGPWGLAIAGATLAIGFYAQAQADARARVDELKSSLDQQTGAFTGSTKKIMAKDIIDFDGANEGWHQIWKFGRDTATEVLDKVGVGIDEVTTKLADPKMGQPYMDAWKKIGSIATAQGTGAIKVTDELAAAVGIPREELEKLDAWDAGQLAGAIGQAGREAQQSQREFKELAEATNTSTVAAAQLAANYEILSSSTGSVDSKVSALKQNLDILNGGMQTARRASRDYAEQTLNTTDNIKKIAEANGATISANGRMTDSFRKTLLAADGTFSNASKGAIDFSKEMDAASTSVLQVGIAEMNKLQQAGAELPEAQAGALKAMEKPMADLRKRLSDLGFDAGQVNGIMAQLGLDPEKLRGALVVETGDAEKKIARANLMAAAFAQGNYTVALAAQSDEVKAEMMKVEEFRKAYEEGGWEAVLKVINEGGPKIEEYLLGLTEAKNKEDVKKVLDAEFKGKTPIAEAGKALDGWNRTPAAIKELKGTDKATPAAKTAVSSVEAFNFLPEHIRKLFVGEDQTTVPAGIARDAVARFDALTPAEKFMTGHDLTSGAAGAATGSLDIFNQNNPAAKPLSAFDNTAGGLISAQGSMNSLTPVTKGLFAANEAEAGKAAAQKTFNQLQAVTRGLFGKNEAFAGKDAAQKTLDTFKGKSVNLEANDLASTVIRTVANATIGDKTFNIIGVLGGVSAAVRAALGMARGGIMSGGGVQTFANGGFSGDNVKSFARGSEKHVAQIAKGKWPVRIWAEPETGGEAYLPLGKSKRKRSTEILEQVAKMFGMGVYKYANGGVSGGSSSSSSSSYSSSIPSGSGVAPAMMSRILQELKKGSTLTKSGEFIVDGLIAGVNNKSDKAAQAMTDVAGSLDDAVRTRLEIHSPSKTFLGLGKHIIDGLTVGIKTNSGQVHKQISTLANRIYVAAKDIQKATGRSIGSSMTLLNRHKTLSAGWRKTSAAKYSDAIVDYYQKTGRTGNATLADIVRAREDVNVRLGAATKKLKDLQTARNDVFKDISGKMKGEFKLGTNIIGDTNPYIPQMRFSDVKNYASGLASRLKTFNGKIAALKKKGVAAGLINEVAQLGSIEGISVADAILQGSASDIKGLNKDYTSIGTISNQIGTTTADAMYKVGIDAQAGLVRGLQKDSASLTKAANGLTNSLIRQVKKNLGIKSPSRVFAQIGVHTSQGFIKGIDSMQSEVDKRVNNMINLDPRQVDSSGTAVTSTTANSGPQQVVNLTVNPSAGMDEKAVGRAAVKELNWQLLSR